MPIPVFAFEQLPIGEATESKRCDIYSFGCSIQNQLHHARARRGRGLEACAAQPAGEIKAAERGADDEADDDGARLLVVVCEIDRIRRNNLRNAADTRNRQADEHKV